ncbi:MAG: lytic murein transglycosylase [Pseudomonadota bacterium]
MQKQDIFHKIFSFIFIVSLVFFANDVGNTATTLQSENSQEFLFQNKKGLDHFIQKMVSKHQFSEAQLKSWFKQITPNTTVIALMNRQAEDLPWHAYQALVLNDNRIKQGILFWQTHEQTIEKVAKTFGIEPEIIVAILGLESSYGKITGNFSVFEALSTLAFEYPRRADFFEKELTHYLLLTREEGFDPLSIKGSYAGAMGPAQFMPSSYRQYAVNVNQDGNRDILTNIPNILGSIAHYFRSHGWQSGAPVAYSAQVSNDGTQSFQSVKKPSISGPNTVEKWHQQGITLVKPGLATKQAPNTLTKLLTLEGKNKAEHWMTYPNFDVIKRYNQSNHYAMAVYLLGEQIKAGKIASTKNMEKSES